MAAQEAEVTDEDGIDGPFERGMSRIPAARGVCRVCRRLYAVKADGSVRGHRHHGRPCAGSGVTPEAK